jgi:demethylmenaquinone methyltransferase/2-methoxy-6-polyprenyl-1,4-benzoquinol methylase
MTNWGMGFLIIFGLIMTVFAGFLGAWAISPILGLPPAFYAPASLLKGLPGIASMCVVLPFFLNRLKEEPAFKIRRSSVAQTHREYFNDLASEWDNMMPNDPRLEELLSQFRINSGESILDAGSGTGRLARHLQGIGTNGQVIACDIAEQMLFQAKKSNQQSNTHWCCSDICSLSFKNNVFHKIICFSTFPHLHHPAWAIQEFQRVLRAGGQVLILHLAGSKELNKFHASLKGMVNRDRLPSASKLAKQLNNTGFKILQADDQKGLYWVQAMKI